MLSASSRSFLRRYPILRGPFRAYTRMLDRAKMTDHVFMVVAAIVIGVLGGLGAVGFRFLIKLFHRGFWGHWEYATESIRGLAWHHILLVPAVGGLLVGLIVHFFAREAKGHGVPEVMEAVALKGGIIRPRVVIAKSLASALSIASGGSVGREGPIVQIGSAIGSTVGQILQVSRGRLRTFVGCGAAAGIAATFNAPVAGALFAVEVILGDFGVAAFSPIVISSVMATVVSRHYLGDFPAFEVPEYVLVSPWELAPYLVLGLVAGAVGVVFIKTLYLMEDGYDALRLPPYVKPVTGGLAIGAVGIFCPQIFGVGYEAINQALLGQLTWTFLLVLIVVKLFATSITIGSGGSGGIFAPSLFMGAMTGGSIGHLMHGLFPAVTAGSGAYALVAMGALVSATTHAPITAIVMIFELTNDYKIILPLMISCIIATLVAIKLNRDSIYTLKLMRRGADIRRGREVNVLKSLKVRSQMRRSVDLIPHDLPLRHLLSRVLNSSQASFCVVEGADEMVGIITESDLRPVMVRFEELKDLLIAGDLMRPAGSTVREEDGLDYVMKQFGRMNVDELPVVAGEGSNRVVGMIRRVDLIAAYNREVFKREMAGDLAETIGAMDRLRHIEVVEGYAMVEVEAPTRFIGKTLKQIGVRTRHGVEVILVRRRIVSEDDEVSFEPVVPDADSEILEGDILLLFGPEAALERLKKL